jgi:hypothetical protein
MDAQLGIAREQRLIEEMKARLTLPAPDDVAKRP